MLFCWALSSATLLSCLTVSIIRSLRPRGDYFQQNRFLHQHFHKRSPQAFTLVCSGGSDGEAQVRAVVEGVEPWFEAFGRGETADEMRVAGFEFRERPFGLVKRGFEEGVAVAGEHYVVAEGDHDGEHGGVLAGIWMAIGYVGAGLLNCITIIGIPFGIQSFKMAKLALWPFGSQIRSL